MHTELTAVPHAGLGYHFLRVQVRTIGSWGLQEEVGPKAQDRKRRTGRDDVVRTCLRNATSTLRLTAANVKIQAGTQS